MAGWPLELNYSEVEELEFLAVIKLPNQHGMSAGQREAVASLPGKPNRKNFVKMLLCVRIKQG